MNAAVDCVHSNRNNILIVIVVFLLFLAILHGLPLTVDDNGFRQCHFSDNAQAFAYVLSYGNGRLLGNGGIIFLTHHLLAADIIRAVVLTGITVLIPSILDLSIRRFAPVAMLFVLLISPEIFGQTYSWLSGFQNYVPPVFLFLSGIHLIQKAVECNKLHKSCRMIAAFFCGVCMQLYIEHSTGINLLLSAILLCCILRKNHLRPYRCSAVVFFAGCLAGTAIMLAVLIQHAPLSNGGTIGHTSYLSGGLKAFAYGMARNWTQILCMYSENIAILGVLAVVFLFIMIKTDALPRKTIITITCGLMIPMIVFILQSVIGLSAWHGKLTVYESTLIGMAMIIYILFLIFGFRGIFLNEQTVYIKKAAFLAACALVSLIPLLFVWPVGERCLFHSYVFLIGSVMCLLGEIREKGIAQINERAITVATSVLLAVVVISQVAVFSDIRRMVSIRDAWLEEQVHQGADSAAFFLIPSPYIYESWYEESDHYGIVDGHKILLKILPADVWFRTYYYHYT